MDVSEETSPLEQLRKLHFYVTTPQNDSAQPDVTSLDLSETFGELPRKVAMTKFFDHGSDPFLQEMFTNVTYSNPLLFFLLNRGRLGVNIAAASCLVGSLVVMLLAPIVASLVNYNLGDLRYLAFILIPASTLLFLFSEEVSEYILKTAKPGDVLRILAAPDEVIMVTRKRESLLNGQRQEFSSSVPTSKKTEMCIRHIKQFDRRKQKRLSDYVICFLCTDYLLHTGTQEALRDYVLEKSISVLVYLNAFERDNKFVLYYLGIRYIDKLDLATALGFLEKRQLIEDDDSMVEAWIVVLKFALDKNLTLIST